MTMNPTVPSNLPMDPTRRHILTGMMTAAAGGATLGMEASVLQAEKPRHPDYSGISQWNVLQFGAKGNGRTDNTKAFQTALDAAGAAGGGTVFAPPGDYRFAGTHEISTRSR